MAIEIYGASDDLIEIEGDISEEFSHYETAEETTGVLLACSEGTLLRVRYDKEGVWRISPVVRGSADLTVTQGIPDDAYIHTDRAILTGDIKWVALASEYASK